MRRVQPPAPRMLFRRFALGSLTLLVATLCLVSCANPLGAAPAESPTATALPATPTATETPEDKLRNEIAAGATLRGQIEGTDPELQADGMLFRIWDALPTPSLADAQADAYQIFKAVWTGASYQIPSDWEIHLVFLIGASPAGLGTPIAVANLHYQTAHNFPWAQLTPAQAWQRYDGTLYEPNGIAP